MEKRKLLYAGGVLAVCSVVAAILVIFIGNSKAVNKSIVNNAPFLSPDSVFLEGYEPTNCFSESFYSTVYEPKMFESVQIFENAQAFSRWSNKHVDIKIIRPTGRGGSMATERFNDGYVALVTSIPDLQLTDRNVLVKCMYINEANDVIISFGAASRNPTYEYDQDPSTECRQVYTVFYLKPETINTINSLTFTIDPTDVGERASA